MRSGRLHAPSVTNRMLSSGSSKPSQALREPLARARGCVLNLVDTHTRHPLPHYSLYCMAKNALATLTLALARELAPEIRVNGISPGAILWPEGDGAPDISQQQKILQQIPLQRLGTPDEIADTVLFLVRANYVTGQIIGVDGGRSL